MRKLRKSHLLVGALALAMIAVAAGTATASNMAFKINRIIYRPGSVGGTGLCTACDNRVSLPFNNPFIGKRLRDFCDTNGNGIIGTTDPADTVAFVGQPGRVVSGSGTAVVVDITAVDFSVTHNCALSVSNNPLYRATYPVTLRAKASGIPAGDLNLIFVGSDSPGTQILVYNASTRGGTCPGSVCDTWADLVYHTTATNLRGLCDTNGDGVIQAAVDAIQFVSQQGRQLTSTTSDIRAVDAVVTHNCDLAVSPNPPITIGGPVRLRLRGSAAAPRPDFLLSESHF